MANDKLPFTEHLAELRKRIVVSLTVVFVIFIFCFNYSENLLELLMFPLKSKIAFSSAYPFIMLAPSDLFNKIHEFQALGIAEGFMVNVKIAFVASLMLSLPVILFQFWKFISPGLIPKEKKYIAPFVIIATSLFMIGAVFCFLFVLPFAFEFLLTYKTKYIKPNPTAAFYFDFCLKFLLAFGAIFELPIVIVFLTRMGVVTPKTLAKNRKYAVLIAFIAAAVLTPTPDWFNQILMAIPIIILYEAGIIVSRIFARNKTADKAGKGNAVSARE